MARRFRVLVYSRYSLNRGLIGASKLPLATSPYIKSVSTAACFAGSADNPLFPFLFEFYDNVSASPRLTLGLGLVRKTPRPVRFESVNRAARAFLAAPRSTKKANSSLKLKWIFIDCFFTPRLCNYLGNFSQQSHFYPRPCSFFSPPSFAQITQAVL